MGNVTVPAKTTQIVEPGQVLTKDGVTVTIPDRTMTVAQAASTVQTPDPPASTAGSDILIAVLNEDAYQGDAQVDIFADGVLLGTVTITASHAKSEQQFAAFVGSFSKTKAVTVVFKQDAYDNAPDKDRNAYVLNIWVNGKFWTLDKQALLSNGETATANPNGAGTVSSLPSVPVVSGGSTGVSTPVIFAKLSGTPTLVNPDAIPAGAVDVTRLGVKNDGTVDVSAALNGSSDPILYFPNGLYLVDAGITFKPNVTYIGKGSAVLQQRTGGKSIGQIGGNNVGLKGLTFSRGAVQAWSRVTGLQILYNQFLDHIYQVPWADGCQLFFQNGASGLIRGNTFSNRMPPQNVILDFRQGGCDPDYGAGSPPCGICIYGAENLEVSYNSFKRVYQPMKTLFLPGESTSSYRLKPGVKFLYNYAEAPHRIFLEMQDMNSDLIVQGNVAKNWFLPYWESYFLSLASPQSLRTQCLDNFGYHGDAPLNIQYGGIGIEFGAQNGVCNNNTIYGPAWQIMMFGYGGKNNHVEGNRIACNNTDPKFQYSGINDEHAGWPTYSTIVNNDLRPGGGVFPADWKKYDLSLAA
jgi:hypothetical protein